MAPRGRSKQTSASGRRGGRSGRGRNATPHPAAENRIESVSEVEERKEEGEISDHQTETTVEPHSASHTEQTDSEVAAINGHSQAPFGSNESAIETTTMATTTQTMTRTSVPSPIYSPYTPVDQSQPVGKSNVNPPVENAAATTGRSIVNITSNTPFYDANGNPISEAEVNRLQQMCATEKRRQADLQSLDAMSPHPSDDEPMYTEAGERVSLEEARRVRRAMRAYERQGRSIRVYENETNHSRKVDAVKGRRKAIRSFHDEVSPHPSDDELMTDEEGDPMSLEESRIARRTLRAIERLYHPERTPVRGSGSLQ